MPAAIYIETHGGDRRSRGLADDHAGVDIGRTFTEHAARVDAGRVSAPRARRVVPRPAGIREAPPKWAHAALALASRAWLGDDVLGADDAVGAVDPGAVLEWPSGSSAMATSAAGRRAPVSVPREGRAMLRAWLESAAASTEARSRIDRS